MGQALVFQTCPKGDPAGTKLEPFNGRFKAFMRFTCSLNQGI